MEPIALHEFMDRLFLKPTVQMPKPIERNQFLIGAPTGIGIVAEALKTVMTPRIVHGADKHIKLNELNVHRKTILPV